MADLDIESDPSDLTLWQRAAEKYAAALHLELSDLTSWRDRVLGVMGAEWLKAQEASLDRDRAIHELHHLFTILRSGAEAAVIEVAELAKYLEAFEGDEALSHVVSHLRTAPDYRAALFELAMAYRWKIAGAEIRLAPLLQSGKRADFSAKIEGLTYTVEASSSPRELANPEASSFVKAIYKTLRASKLDDRALAIELVIEKHLPGDIHGAVQRTLRESLKQFSRDPKQIINMPLQFGSIKVREATRNADDHAEGRWDVGQQLLLKDPPPDDTLFEAHKEATVGYGPAIYVRLPRDGRDLYSFILSKYRRERKQLGGTDDRVILLDASSAKSDVLQLDMQRLNATIGEDLLQDAKTSALWIVSRGWSTYFRPTYRAVTMSNPAAGHPLPPSFGDRVSDIEYRRDLLTGKDYDWTPNRGFKDPI